MYYNPLTKEEEFHELVKEIESQSAYKRVPSPEKKYMSVAEMGRLLGLKKTDRYWLVHKNFFKTEVIYLMLIANKGIISDKSHRLAEEGE